MVKCKVFIFVFLCSRPFQKTNNLSPLNMKYGNIGSSKLQLCVCHSKLINVFTIKIIENPIKNRFNI